MGEKLISIVTGANRGIDFETARQLAIHGVKVILTARDTANGMEAANRLVEEGLDVDFHQLDVTNDEDIKELAADIREKFGRLNIHINNAGIAIDDHF
jgi:NAD(P)-dependent dehydrogenase (short-subunit alcohol dehydrogenase family)